jgi:NADH dehydrogenase
MIRTATVFGGTGFLGHAVIQALAQQGFFVRVPTRDPDKALDLKPLGAVGQIIPFRTNLRVETALAELVKGADVVINLIGVMDEKSGMSFQTAHVEMAAKLARLAYGAGAKHFIHISALGAAMNAESAYARSKAIGEEAVRAFFPKAIILRPSLIFGPRDTFLNRFAVMARYVPFLPLIGGGKTRFQPVYVGDIAAAIMTCLGKSEAQGRTFELGGPDVLTLKDMLEILLNTMKRKRCFLSIPWPLASALAFFLERLPSPPLTRDQLLLLKRDNVLREGTGSVGRFEELGINPASMKTILGTYLS